MTTMVKTEHAMHHRDGSICTVKLVLKTLTFSTCISLFLADLQVSACAGQLLHCQVASQISLYVRRNAVTSAIQLHCTDL